MEIITSIYYDGVRHSTIDFVKKYFAPMGSTMMKTTTVDSIITRRSIPESMRLLLSTKWHYTRMVGNMVAGQMHVIELVDDAFLHVYLLENVAKDKLVLYFSGQHGKVLTIDFGFIGNPATFKKYLDVMTVSHFEAYNHISHLIEDEDET